MTKLQMDAGPQPVGVGYPFLVFPQQRDGLVYLFQGRPLLVIFVIDDGEVVVGISILGMLLDFLQKGVFSLAVVRRIRREELQTALIVVAVLQLLRFLRKAGNRAEKEDGKEYLSHILWFCLFVRFFL